MSHYAIIGGLDKWLVRHQTQYQPAWGIGKAQKVVSTHPKSIAINRMAVKAEQTHTRENTNSTFVTKS